MLTKQKTYSQNKEPSNENNKPIQRSTAIQMPTVKQAHPIEIIQRVQMSPDSLTRNDVMQLQKTIGNRVVIQMLSELKGNLKPQNREKPMQLKDGDTGKTQSTEVSKTGMQHSLKAGLEALSGLDMSDVRVHHNSDKPQQVGALAYTQGNDIHVAPGQERHLPHEGWHVVQQKQGRVKPTLQMKTGVYVNDDAGLEREADIMGERAAKGKKSDTDAQKGNSLVIQSRRDEGDVIQRTSSLPPWGYNGSPPTGWTSSSPSSSTTSVQEKGEIKIAYYGETSDNVKKIQDVLKQMNYWAGNDSDKSTGYFGDVTKNSLVNFQLGYMKLSKNDLYDKNGKYAGCGPRTAESLSYLYKTLNSSSVPEQAKNGIMGVGKRDANNAAYSWDIEAGKYNGYIKETQEKLITIGYKLSKYGADGKWSNGGETYAALMKFQSTCKSIYDIVSRYGGEKSRKQVEHFRGLTPTGKLDKATYEALQEQVDRKLRGQRTVIVKVSGNTPKTGGVSNDHEENPVEQMMHDLDESAGLGSIEKNYNVMNEYGEVHDQVQARAASKYNLAFEYRVPGGGLQPDGKTDGWADLVDTGTHEVWEIKNDTPDWNESSGIGRKQLSRYINASKKYGNFRLVRGNPRIKVEPFKTSVFGKPVTVTVRSGLGTVDDLENGMIYYKVKYDKDKDKKPKDIPIIIEKNDKNSNNKSNQDGKSNVIKFPTQESKKDQQVAAASSTSERAWWEIPAGIGLIIVCGAATVVLAADDATGIGALDDPAMAATIGGLGKGAQMVFGW